MDNGFYTMRKSKFFLNVPRREERSGLLLLEFSGTHVYQYVRILFTQVYMIHGLQAYFSLSSVERSGHHVIFTCSHM